MATIFALSCESENNNVVVEDLPADYFPLKKGVFQVYDIHKVEYELGVRTERNYQLKTVLVDSIDRGNGTYSYVQYRYERGSSNQGWVYVSTWGVQADDRELIVNEGSTAYLNYKFPLSKGYTWNGNTYNNGEPDDYIMEDVKVNKSIGNENFSDCIVINQNDNQDFVVYLDQRKEIYARNVGLVSKEVRQLHYCTDSNSGCLGQKVVEEGMEYTQTLVLHGEE
ncbi:hypothetical protein WBG78_17250 [Chryseolinea sp. T2]|uniref:hypothetical protein n=1 Tax=Chryseolinea sp. T2 TaxID=3129255 RepID=UPI0030774D5F